MSENATEFERLMDGLRRGSQDAAWKLIELYAPQIQRVARRMLTRRFRAKFDSSDFVQAMWLSFFRNPSRIRQFTQPKDLVRYLTAIVRNKIVDEVRRLGTKKQNLAREKPLDSPTLPRDALVSGQPRPSEIAMARERWQCLMDGQPAHYREIVRLRFIGETHVAIAGRVHVNERTVRKVLKKLLTAAGD